MKGDTREYLSLAGDDADDWSEPPTLRLLPALPETSPPSEPTPPKSDDLYKGFHLCKLSFARCEGCKKTTKHQEVYDKETNQYYRVCLRSACERWTKITVQ